MGHPIDEVTWRKSSYSGSNGGNCIEVATLLDDGLAVRDSKDPHGPNLAFSPAEWRTFIASVKKDDLDLS